MLWIKMKLSIGMYHLKHILLPKIWFIVYDVDWFFL